MIELTAQGIFGAGSTLLFNGLPLATQAKMLRALQNGEIQRLGADQPRHVDVRVIAATNRRLWEEVREGRFRADLYHRLSVFTLGVPPLRELDQDKVLLLQHFKKNSFEFDDSATAAAQSRDSAHA